MAGAKEIRGQIRSIQNIQKSTKALEMVAASKVRKAQARMASTRPYAEKMHKVIGHLANANPEYRHPFLIEREARRVGFIVISTDRGQCGGLNVNLFKTTLNAFSEWRERDIEVDFCIIGVKGMGFFKRVGGNIIAHKGQLGDSPHLSDLIGPVKTMLDSYNEKKIDRLFLIHNVFVNTMTHRPTVTQLLPIEPVEDQELAAYWDYLYEPDARDLLDGVLMRYVESQVYQGVVENAACEQAARMVAMKSASDNAGEIISDLQLAYNKARQAAITRELAEIVGGAAAVQQ